MKSGFIRDTMRDMIKAYCKHCDKTWFYTMEMIEDVFNTRNPSELYCLSCTKLMPNLENNHKQRSTN